jgi:hypothetical protein
MTFRKLQNTSGLCSASELHSKYNALASGKSRVQHWKSMLGRGFSFSELLDLIDFLNNRGTAMPSSATVLREIKGLMEEVKQSTSLRQVEIMPEAEEALAVITDMESTPGYRQYVTPIEHVQEAFNVYREYLALNPVEYDVLLPPKSFVILWFTKICQYGTPASRRFSLHHPRWLEYLSLVRMIIKKG